MKLIVKKGRTSLLVRIFIQDSSSTTGAGLTGLTSASTGLVCYRARDDDGNAGATQVTLSAGTRGTWSSGGFVEKDATNMPGVYELGLPDAGQATGSETVTYMLKGATNMAPLALEIQLVAYDPQDSVHLGLTCLPNTAVTTNGSLITSGSGTDQLTVSAGIASADVKKWNGTTVATPATAGIPDINVKNINNVAAATPGASGGILIAGTNAATTINGLTLAGVAASGATPATAGLTVTGGAASTTGGGVSAPAISATGGAGAASTNGASAGATIAAGGTTTVSGNDGVTMTGTGNGNGLTLTHAGTGKDLNATTSGPLQVNATQINGVSAGSVTTISANLGTTQPVNFTGAGASALVKSDMVDVAGAAVSTSTAQLGVNVVNIAGAASVGAAGSVGIDWAHVANPTTALDLSGTTIKGIDGVTFPTNFSAMAIDANGRVKVQSTFNINTAEGALEFLMTDSTNHNPATGKTITATRSIDGGAFAATANAATEVGNGIYTISAAATDLNGKVITFRFTATGCDDTFVEVVTDP